MKKIIIEFEAKVSDKFAEDIKIKGMCISGIDSILFLLKKPKITKADGIKLERKYTFKCKGARIE